jgi:hypothetical protein
MATETNHAEQNAAAWAESIVEMVAAINCDYERLEELKDERAGLVADIEEAQANSAAEPGNETATAERDALKALADWDDENAEELKELQDIAIAGESENQDEARERIEQSVLSVEVRGDWHEPGAEDEGPSEFKITLTTGGPALRLCGDLNDHGEPTRAYLQYQDWGTPWTDFHGDITGDTLLAFASCFFFTN